MADVQRLTQNDDEIDLSALLGTLVDHKWLIISATIIFFLISGAYAALATPIYEANAVVQVEQKVPDLPGLSAVTQTLGASSSEATTEIAIITSRSVINQAAEKLNLNVVVSPYRFPLIGDFIARRYTSNHPGIVASPWIGMNSYGWGGEKLEITQLDVSDGLLGKPLTLIAGEHGTYILLNDNGDILVHGQVGRQDKNNDVDILVSSLLANPGTHFKVVRNRDLTTLNLLQQEITASEQGADSGIIKLVYDDADPNLATRLLDEISDAYIRQNIKQNAEESANSLDFVKQQLPIVRDQLTKAQAALSAYQTKVHSVDITTQTKALLDQVVAVESSIQQLSLQKADMERRFTKDHPAYQALMQQVSQLVSQKASLEKQVNNLPDTQKDLLRLTGDVQVSNTTYTELLNQAQQLSIAKAGTVGNVRIVDKAAVDVTHPVEPKKALIVIVGTMLGGFLGVVFVFLKQMLNRGVEDPSAIENLGLPVYASIPLSEQEHNISSDGSHRRSDGRQHLLAVQAPADLAIESLRSLRTSLHFARLEAKNNLLMISGSSPNAGKTFVSANLAGVIAQAGQRVLLIDADMRKGGQHKVMGGQAENGLSELISGQIDLAEAIRPVFGIANLHFIARGKVPPNPSELLMHPNFTELLGQVMSTYDLIVIDTPPILAVTDAALIGRHAGCSLLVVRFGLNQSREIALAKQRFEQSGVEIKGAIFNAVERRSAGYYSYAYYEYNTAK